MGRAAIEGPVDGVRGYNFIYCAVPRLLVKLRCFDT